MPLLERRVKKIMTANRTVEVEAKVVKGLGELPAATIHEVMGKKGAMDAGIKGIDVSMKLYGRALTVQCRPGDNLALHKAISIAKPGDVLVATMDGHLEGGAWGEIATVAAQVRGITGLVIDGGVRDTEQIIKLGFPVFSRGVSIKGTTKKSLAGVNIPIVCGGVVVKPGDIVIGDRDGVVVVPTAQAEEVLALATEKEDAEAKILDRIRAGELTLDLLDLRPILAELEQ